MKTIILKISLLTSVCCWAFVASATASKLSLDEKPCVFGPSMSDLWDNDRFNVDWNHATMTKTFLGTSSSKYGEEVEVNVSLIHDLLTNRFYEMNASTEVDDQSGGPIGWIEATDQRKPGRVVAEIAGYGIFNCAVSP